MPEPAITSFELRAPRSDERDALIAFIATLNQPGAQHCLHLAETEAGVRADLERDEIDIGAAFLVAADADGLRGAVGMNRSADTGWLLGPWARDGGDRIEQGAVRVALLRAALAAPGLVQVRAFSDVRSEAPIAELEAEGFVRLSEVHVMQAQRSAWRDAGPNAAIAEAEDGDEPALAALHRAAFPHAWLAADELLAYARKHGRMLVARDAAGALLGSLCLSFNAALPEADVEFIAVQPEARGRGIGRALLQAALRASFEGSERECVNLCVNGANFSALRLYVSSGFEQLYSGANLRWLRNGDELAAGSQSGNRA